MKQFVAFTLDMVLSLLLAVGCVSEPEVIKKIVEVEKAVATVFIPDFPAFSTTLGNDGAQPPAAFP